MIQSDSIDRLIQALSANLTTVRRLPSPGLRALMWLAILASIALALAMVSDVKAMSSRLMAAPDMWLAALASMLTAAESAKSFAPGHHAKGIHGASAHAPGHVKKSLHMQSARGVAPGHMKH